MNREMYYDEPEYEYHEDVQAKKKLPYNEMAARERATKLSYASGIENESVIDSIAEELMLDGESATADELEASLQEKDKYIKAEAATEIANEFGADAALDVLSDRIKDVNGAVDESVIANYVSPPPDRILTEEQLDSFDALIEQELNLQAQLQREYAEGMEFQDGFLRNVGSFFESMIPFVEQNSVRNLMNGLEEEFEANFTGSSFGAFIASGSHLKVVREWFTSLDNSQQLDVMRWMNENASEYSGLFGSNDFIRQNVIGTVASEAVGDWMEGNVDTNVIINNVISGLDLMMVGGIAKNIILGGNKGLLGAKKGSVYNTAGRLDPEKGSTLGASGVLDATGKTAKNLGTTREDIILQDLMYKFEGFSQHPNFSNSLLERQETLMRSVIGRDANIDLALTEAERIAQRNRLERHLEDVQGQHLWANSSSISRVTGEGRPTGWSVKAEFGRDATRGFTREELSDAVARLQKKFPEASIEQIVKRYDGEVVTQATKTSAPRMAEEAAVARLREFLTKEAGGRLDREQTKNLPGMLKNLKFDLKNAKDKARALSNPKSNVSRKLKDEVESRVTDTINSGGKNMLPKTARKRVEAEIKEEIADIEARIKGADTQLAAASRASEAEANLSRLDQGHYDKLTGEAAKKWKDYRKEIETTSTTSSKGEGREEIFLRLSMDDESVHKSNLLFDLDEIYLKGQKAKFIGDITAGLGKQYSDVIVRAFDVAKGTEAEMIKMLEPLMKASNENKKRILSLADEGNKTERLFSPSDIIDQLPTGMKAKDVNQVIEGYYALRTFADTAYVIHNRSYRNALQAQGAKYIHVGDEFKTLGSVVKRENVKAEVSVAFNPRTGETISNRGQIDELMDQGYEIVKSRELHGRAGSDVGQTQYVLVKTMDDVDELPMQILNYREGYLPRMYTSDQYFINVKPKDAKINGKTVKGEDVPSQQLLTARSMTEAKDIVARLQRDNPDAVVDYRNARELNPDERVAAEFSVDTNTRGLFYSKRGEHVKGADGNLSDTQDVITSLSRMASSVSQKVELEPVINLMKQRFMNTFKDVLESPTSYPTSATSIVSKGKVSNELRDKAVAVWNYIDSIESSPLLSKNWRTASVRFGEWLEGVTGSSKLGHVFRTSVAERDPFSLARGATFMAMIVLNPFRQLFINVQQQLLLTGLDPKYILSGQGLRQGTALALATTEKAAGKSLKSYARMAGIPEKEFIDMVEGFKKTGMIQAIDSHIIGRDAMLSINNEISRNTAGKVIKGVGNTAKKGLNTIREVGFDMGERVNVTSSYMLARKRWMEANPNMSPTSREALAAIHSDARQLTMAMTEAATFGYQRGILSLGTQFLSVQHKAMSIMLRGVAPSLGNKAFSPQEARRIAAFQVLLYGSSGVGLHQAVDWALDQMGVGHLDPEVKHLLYGGTYDMLVNAAIRIATGEESDLHFASSIAAGQGFHESVGTLVKDFLSGDKDIVQLMAGASYNTASRVNTAMNLTGMLIGAELGQAEDPELRQAALEGWGRISGGYNNFVKMRAMMNYGTFVNANDGPIPVPASQAEAWVAGLLGIEGYKVSAFYDSITTQAQKRKELEDTALQYFNVVERQLAIMVSQTQDTTDPRSIEAMRKFIYTHTSFLKNSLGEQDYYVVMNNFQDLVQQRIKSGDETFANNLARLAMTGNAGSGTQDILNRAGRSGLINAEEKNKLQSVFDYLFKTED